MFFIETFQHFKIVEWKKIAYKINLPSLYKKQGNINGLLKKKKKRFWITLRQ